MSHFFMKKYLHFCFEVSILFYNFAAVFRNYNI